MDHRKASWRVLVDSLDGEVRAVAWCASETAARSLVRERNGRIPRERQLAYPLYWCEYFDRGCVLNTEDATA
jgi:hypothetical protein